MNITLQVTLDERDDVVDILDVLSHGTFDANGVRRFKVTTHVRDAHELDMIASELYRRTKEA